MFDLNKKEKPFTSFSGFGGGGLGLAGGAISAKTYVDDVFSAYVYEGNGTSQTINNGIDLSGEGGLVWIKNREYSGGSDHIFTDTERGTNTILESNRARVAQSKTDMITSFTSTGFAVADNGNVNENNDGHCSWTFRKAPGFFDVVTYTGNNTAGRTVAHNLGSVPGMIVVKCLNDTEGWHVYHRSIGATKYLLLNSTNTENSGSTVWNNTTPTSTHFTVSTNPATNGNGLNYVAYVFAHDDAQFGTDDDESIIKCGSFTGGGSLSNPKFINVGFEPQFVLWKRTDSTSQGDWYMHDNMRGMARSFSNQPQFQANNNDAEISAYGFWAYGNGFAFSEDLGGGNFVYMAIRRPNKPPEAAINVFTIDTSEGTSPTPPQFTSGFVTDFIIRKTFNAANNQFGSRLQGTNYMSSYSITPESGASLLTWDFMDGWSKSVSDPPDTNLGCYMFKRAPGFMDVVTWTGDGAAVKNVAHNLEEVPEMVITKMRTYSGGGSYGGDRWYVYHKDVAGSLGLNENSAIISSDTIFNSTPTATNLPFDNPSYDSLAVNGNNDTYVGYLFSTLSGISKVGSYSGTGNNVNVDCGFTSGARFIMIKRINGTGGWHVWDTLRGIGSGNDPYWLTNTTDNPVTNTDYVDPFSSGFTVTSSAPAALNASGGTYLFLAIA